MSNRQWWITFAAVFELINTASAIHRIQTGCEWAALFQHECLIANAIALLYRAEKYGRDMVASCP
jgi:hypothetical protein